MGVAVLGEGLSVQYGRRIIFDKVTFAVQQGETASIVGTSGAGKSTLLSCLLGLIVPRRGSLTVAGKNIAKLSSRQRREYRRSTVSAIFQHGELMGELEPAENVAVAALLGGRSRTQAWDVSKRMLEDIGVPAAGMMTRDLSGGEQQRVAVARALVNEPGLVVADEPTGSLDADTRDAVADLVFSIPDRWGATLLMVTHDPAMAERTDKQFKLSVGEDGPAYLEEL